MYRVGYRFTPFDIVVAVCKSSTDAVLHLVSNQSTNKKRRYNNNSLQLQSHPLIRCDFPILKRSRCWARFPPRPHKVPNFFFLTLMGLSPSCRLLLLRFGIFPFACYVGSCSVGWSRKDRYQPAPRQWFRLQSKSWDCFFCRRSHISSHSTALLLSF